MAPDRRRHTLRTPADRMPKPTTNARSLYDQLTSAPDWVVDFVALSVGCSVGHAVFDILRNHLGATIPPTLRTLYDAYNLPALRAFFEYGNARPAAEAAIARFVVRTGRVDRYLPHARVRDPILLWSVLADPQDTVARVQSSSMSSVLRPGMPLKWIDARTSIPSGLLAMATSDCAFCAL
jgi:hypothetical protein